MTSPMDSVIRNFLGSSDAPVIAGISKHQTEDQLADRILYNKRPVVDKKTQALFDRGHCTEPIILSVYEALERRKLTRPGTIYHPIYPFVAATPDGVDEMVSTVIEAKSVTRFRKGFGYAGSSDVPPEYEVQIQWLLEVLNLEKAELIGAFGVDLESSGAFRIDWVSRFPIKRDRATGANLMALAVNFWTKRIQPYQYKTEVVAHAAKRKAHPPRPGPQALNRRPKARIA